MPRRTHSAAATRTRPMLTYNDQVFINCPFDPDYRDFFRAIVFAVQDCGFVARSALEISDSGEARIGKIKRIIEESRHGVHDISRVELDPQRQLPRFNMPLELGLFLGAQSYGDADQKQKRCLVLDSDRFRYQALCSDIAGQDIKSHGNDPLKALTEVRDWLGSFRSEDGVLLPGAAEMRKRYERFQLELPTICEDIGLEPGNLLFGELRTIVQEWTAENPFRSRSRKARASSRSSSKH
jgi:hypothetical protein